MTSRRWTWLVTTLGGLLLATAVLGAHEGPPYPIVSDRVVAGYELSVWTDPDSTDDGSPGGRFWVTLRARQAGQSIPADTRVDVAITPLDQGQARQVVRAVPVDGAVTNQLAALVMDHEGRFAVRVVVDGSMGRAEVNAEVDATYDLRPPPMLIAVYVLPFLLVGFLWIKLMLRRRRT